MTAEKTLKGFHRAGRVAVPLLALLAAACTVVDDVNGPPRPGVPGLPGAIASAAPLPGASARPAPRTTARPGAGPFNGDDSDSDVDPGDDPGDEPGSDPGEPDGPERPITPIGPPVEPDAPMPPGVALVEGGAAVDLPAGKTLTVAVYGTGGEGEFALTTSDFTPDPAHPASSVTSSESIREGSARKPLIEPDWRALLRAKMAGRYRLDPAARRQLRQAGYEEGSTAPFEIDMLADKERDSEVACTLVKATEHAYFYVDASEPPPTAAIERMAAAWEGGMYAKLRAAFGEEAEDGGDGDPHVCIVLARLEGVGGYFSGANMMPQASGAGAGRKVVYVNMKYVAGEHADERFAQATMAHEFQHMINFSYKGLKNDFNYEESWVDEGLGDLAKDVVGYGWNSEETVVPSRVGIYLEGVPHFQLQLEPKLNPDTSGGYGQSYLFQRYLMDRFGDGTPAAVIQGKEPGQAGVEAVLGEHGATFDQVYRDWVVANLAAADVVLADPRFRYRTIDLRRVPSGVPVELKPLVATSTQATGNQRPWSVSYHQFHATAAQPWTVKLDAASGVRAVAIVADPLGAPAGDE